jgi:uncharacterized protein YcbK (DUF882 family)
MKISKYVSYDEATKSQTATRLGIDNAPTEEHLENMKYVALNVFDHVREFVGGPLHASSFYRSPALNAAIGGSSKTSQHMTGHAIDIDCDTFGFGNNNQVFDFIRKNLEYDQVIGEYPDANGKFAWVHVSLKKSGNRKQDLIKLKDKYILFTDWKPGQV